MILLDLNQVMIANLMQNLGNYTNTVIQIDLFRHMVLNSIRSINFKFRNVYGEMIICVDDKNYWRKKIFPYYKANRKQARDESELDWNAIFESLNTMKLELKENFPYRVLQVETAEADDIIATLCHHMHDEPVMIVSGDKDFGQLQFYDHVKQYDPMHKRTITIDNPERFLKEHIIRGDRGDGIPNFLSPDDVFVTKGRQKTITKAKLDYWLTTDMTEWPDLTNDMLRGWKRNDSLVNLALIPNDIQTAIMNKYNEEAGKTRSKMMTYFVEHKLKNLYESISEF